MTHPPKILMKKLKEIKLISFDVDGVLTDGRLGWGNNGLEQLNFNVKDGTAIKELSRRGYQIVVISATKSNIITNRMSSLGLKYVYTGVQEKVGILQRISTELQIEATNILHIADDRNDLAALKFSGLSCCPSDAITEVKAVCDFVLNTKGGFGVCVELLEKIKSTNDCKV